MIARLFLLLVLVLPLAAGAESFDVPGLGADSRGYAGSLTNSFPAGGTPLARRQAETRAADAQRRNDWAGVATALEARLGAGEPSSDLWLALARAQMRRTPALPARAAQAAWQAFESAGAGPPEIPALLLMAEALRAMDRPEAAIRALEAVTERAPDDAGYRQTLTDARRVAGILVRQVRPETETDPPQACIVFTTAPIRRSDFVPGDWVQVQPPVPGLAVTREGDQLCLAGLPLAATTTVTLRAGMPGEDGLTLKKAAVLPIAMGNRTARLILDSKLFLLPRGQAPRLSLSSVNLSTVQLKLLRLGERSMVPWTRENSLGSTLERYSVTGQEENGKVVWEGKADIPRFEMNRIVRTALPLPDVFDEAGAYLLQVTPGDGTSEYRASAVQVIIRTDLAPTVWRGSDGLTIQVRSFADTSPQAGVQLNLLARSNDILASATTDAAGVARFAAPLLRGTGPQAPQAIHGTLGHDFVALDLTTAAFDLSDRGVEGAPHPGPLDAFAWTDRGIYRPGETVQLMALLRDNAGAPADVPATVVVKRPNGQTFLKAVAPRGADASLHMPLALSASAPAGVWVAEILADPARPAIGRVEFRVDAFVPDRMAVDVAPNGPIVPGQTYALPVTARFLYGAPATGLGGKASLVMKFDPDPPAALAGYRIGLDGEAFAPETVTAVLPETDAAGKATLPLLIKRAPDTTHRLRAELEVGVDDPSGRAVYARTTIPIRPSGLSIGIKPGFADAVDAGADATFEVAAVSPDGVRVPAPARLRLIRERPDWRMVLRGSLASYETVWKDEPLDTADIAIPATGSFRYSRRVDFGRYRLEVVERGGLAATSVRFRSGWVASQNPDTPDKVDVSTDRQAYAAGGTARIHVVAPFSGQATVLTVSDRVHSIRNVDVAAGGSDIDVPVDAAWGPGAYVAVHVFRAGQAAGRPTRAIGVAWVGVDPAARTLAVSMTVPDKVAPRAPVTVPVRTAPGAWVTLAAVDEGVLRLTNFASPNPAKHFLGRRRLGLDIRDDWGRLIPPAEGEATSLRQGGDDGSSALPEIPQKVVALFTPAVQAGVDGLVSIPLDLPDFSGQMRLMAVAWQGTTIGAASVTLVVGDPLIAEPLLPRFLAPGDEARLAVLLHNLDLPAGDAAAVVSVDGPLAIVGETRLVATLAAGAQAIRTTTLRATGVGRGIIRLAVTGPGGFTVNRETAILVRPARAPLSFTAGAELSGGGETRLTPALDRLLPGTRSARAVFGGPVRYDVAALVRSLDAYPLSCLEQSSSRGLPLAMLPDGPVAGPDRAGRLQAAVASVLDRQRYDGGFGLWSATNEAEGWLSAYAAEFLLRARTAGAAVPDGAVKDMLKFLSDATENAGTNPDDMAAQAYRLYVLAMAGQARAGANRVLAEDMAKLPTPLSRAQLGAALALSNDKPRAEAAFAAALAAPARKDWDSDRGSALRDQAAVAVLLKESGLLADRLLPVMAALPGADLNANLLNTQEQAWAAAAAAVLGRDGRPVRIALDGQEQVSMPVLSVILDGPATARNLDAKPVWQTVSATGVPVEAPAAARAGMRVSRKFFTLAGDTFDLDNLRQSTSFVLLVEGRSDDAQDHRAMLLQGLPAGWEIAGRMPSGAVAGMPWLGELTETESQPAADDRFTATMKLTADAPAFRVAVRLRAVTPGSFEMPGATLSDMYRPGVYARQGAARIVVKPAE